MDAVLSVAGTMRSWNTSGIGGSSWAALRANTVARFPPLEKHELLLDELESQEMERSDVLTLMSRQQRPATDRFQVQSDHV